MIDTTAVRNRLLEMAIRGELSDREGSKDEIDLLIKKIKETRELQIKKQETKISKTAEMISEDLFEIPQEWKWVALGDLCIMLSRGKSPAYSEERKYPVFAQKCNQPNCLALEKALFLDGNTLCKWPEYFRLRNEDVVINSTGTGTVGRIGYYLTETLNKNYPFMLPDSHVTVVRVGEGIVSKYIYYALRSGSLQSIIEKQLRGSTNQKEFYIDSVYATPIPIPSTKEQLKIVEKLDGIHEALKIIDELQSQYVSNLEVLKSKLIDAGIQGKLTEQLPEDGNAQDLYDAIQKEKTKLIKEKKNKKEKELPEISEDEVPFEIPANWKWVYLGNLFAHNTGKALNSSDREGTLYEYITTSNLYWNTFILDSVKSMLFKESEIDKCTVKKGDLLVCEGGDIGRAAIWDYDYEMRIQNHIHKLRPYIPLSVKFYYYTFFSYKNNGLINGKGIGLQGLSSNVLHTLIVPLPPLEEQKRIVIRIEELLSAIQQ